MGQITNSIKINRDLTTKKIDRFVVSLYRLPENIQNILAEHVRSISRPILMINESETYQKRGRIAHSARVSYNPITIEFYDDNQSMVVDSLFKQIYRQLGRSTEAFGDSHGHRLYDTAKFDMGIKCYNTFGKNVEEYILKDCFISSLNPNDMNVSADTDSTISIELTFDDLEYIFDR